MNHSSFPWLELLVLVPLVGAIVSAGATGLSALVRERVGQAAALITLGLSIAVIIGFAAHDGGYQFVHHTSWISSMGISWFLGVDGISLFLVGLTALIVPIVLYGAMPAERRLAFTAWVLLLEAASIGAFISLDLLLFFLFFELTLLPSYFLIVGWGGKERSRAAVKFFLYTFFGSAFLLVAIVSLAVLHEHQTGVLTFAFPELLKTHLSSTTELLLFLGFLSAFAVKSPLFPFHTWSPATYREAPTGASILLAAILAKLGTYGFLRFCITPFPHATHSMTPIMLTIAVIGILYGAGVAAVQRDLKQLVAYSSLSQVGFIALGAFALSTQGLSGAVLLMFNHGIITAALFLLIGMIAARRGSWDITQLRGLQGPAPIMAAAFTLVMLASIGLPGLSGFVSEFLVLLGTFATHPWWAAVASFGVVLAALYLLWAYQRVFHGKAEGANAQIVDLSMRERLVLLPLIALIVVLGIFPNLLLDRINPSVQKIVDHSAQVVSSSGAQR